MLLAQLSDVFGVGSHATGQMQNGTLFHSDPSNQLCIQNIAFCVCLIVALVSVETSTRWHAVKILVALRKKTLLAHKLCRSMPEAVQGIQPCLQRPMQTRCVRFSRGSCLTKLAQAAGILLLESLQAL
eukprot:CAMPEP_0177438550 /NCGR_PEP_ID=MMETSP0369-20130122/2821_1 /TAXON_ID=447022 ORGANISM="Scrippsiella hangoei-like, Strain SHHI-4" /NCGR_SAMPLE_ID=MMETSP0369 /ASSEMBLY_ACC=CAM_ASM_000364 /LENGTH=127 /DNA_ID=CAMNT_0018910137 /DNA_START=197 /DNA_END=580 /DNA_ORIENTATION=-